MINGPLPAITPINQVYWDGTAAGELRFCRCKRCDTRFRFVSTWCPTCWSLDFVIETARGTGHVRSYSVVHMAPYESVAARVPYAVALVELTEGVIMMANIVECDLAAIYVGMPLELLFEQRGEVMIPQFRPAGEGAA